jgi:GNAT superfamily N-acetyltransferase
MRSGLCFADFREMRTLRAFEANTMAHPRARRKCEKTIDSMGFAALTGAHCLGYSEHSWRVETVSVGATASVVEIRAFCEDDAAHVRALFIEVNRLLAPPEMQQAFADYVDRALREEIDRINEYYGERHGGFWVAVEAERIVGMFGLEPSTEQAMELRRMYVDPRARGRGIARMMLSYAEEECRRRAVPRINLSTSELQQAALSLYRSSRYRLVREEVAKESSNKTLGGGIRRYYFTRELCVEPAKVGCPGQAP